MALVLALTTATAAAGQDDADRALRDGAWGLQFRIAPNLNLTNFQGGIIAAKYHVTETRALRFGIRLDARSASSESERSRDVEVTDPIVERQFQSDTFDRTQDASNFSVGLESQYIVYPAPARQIKLLVGAGPVIDFSWSHRDEVNVDARSNGSGQESRHEIEQNGRDWSFGAQGVIGGEWFVASRISLSAEYGARTFYSFGSSRREQQSTQATDVPTGTRIMTTTDVSESEHSGWSFGASSVKLGLTLYL